MKHPLVITNAGLISSYRYGDNVAESYFLAILAMRDQMNMTLYKNKKGIGAWVIGVAGYENGMLPFTAAGIFEGVAQLMHQVLDSEEDREAVHVLVDLIQDTDDLLQQR